tara:strand:- start:1236 stop:1400 length:165 start_codon:yes stop_codon:yes gene_type:complete
MGYNGTRLKYIKYYIKLLYSKLVGKKNTNKKEQNTSDLVEKKIKRNKFGFPTFD